MMKSTTASVLLCLMLCIGSCDAQAQNRSLNIILTNGVGFEAPSTQALFRQLKLAGHNVVMSAPYASSIFTTLSGAVDVLVGVGNTPANSAGGTIAAGAPGIGNTTIAPDQYYVNGKPTAAALYGIDILAPRHFGAAKVDLLISGLEPANAAGLLHPHSNAIGLAAMALNRGIPAIAYSAPVTEVQFDLAGQLLVTFLKGLNRTASGGLSFGVGIGLNINLPFLTTPNASDYSFYHTTAGIATNVLGFRFVEKLTDCPVAVANGVGSLLPGVCAIVPYFPTYVKDTNPLSEGNLILNGQRSIAVTVIQGTYQADSAISQSVANSIPFKAINGPTECRSSFNLFDATSNAKVETFSNLCSSCLNGVLVNPPCFINVEVVNETCAVTGPMKIDTFRSPGANLINSRTENKAPYFIFGDNGAGDVLGAALPVPGTYSFRTEFNGKVRDPIFFRLEASFKLYNATSNAVIGTTFSSGAVIMNPPCFMNFEILAPATCAASGAMSIRLIQDGITTISSRSEANPPYFAFGNGSVNGTDVLGQTLVVPGNYALIYRVPGGANTTIPFSLAGVCRP